MKIQRIDAKRLDSLTEDAEELIDSAIFQGITIGKLTEMLIKDNPEDKAHFDRILLCAQNLVGE